MAPEGDGADVEGRAASVLTLRRCTPRRAHMQNIMRTRARTSTAMPDCTNGRPADDDRDLKWTEASRLSVVHSCKHC